MIIDVSSEDLLTFGQLAEEAPRRRMGRKVSIATIYRWAARGVRGVRLETLQTPGGLVTSRQAFQRFLEALTERSPVGASAPSPASPPAPAPAPALRSPASRRKAAERAARDLEDMGVL